MNPKIKNFTVNIVVQHLRNKKFLISRPSKRQQKLLTVLSALSVTLKRLTKRKKLLTATKKELTKTLTKKLDYFSVHLVVQKSSLMRQLLQLGAIIVIIRNCRQLAFFDKKQIQNLSGVYFPYWAVDAELSGGISAQATNLRVWIVGDTEYTEHSQYEIQRGGETKFKDLIKNALKKNLSDKMVGAVQPFDMTAAIPFKNQYLSGFLTEKRDIEFPDMKENVEREFRQYADGLMESTIIGYTSVSNLQSNQQIKNIDEDYVLLPIWLVTYKEAGNDRLFYYAMNGQTGKVAGLLPIDKKKLWTVAIGIFILVLLLGIIVGYLLS